MHRWELSYVIDTPVAVVVLVISVLVLGYMLGRAHAASIQRREIK